MKPDFFIVLPLFKFVAQFPDRSSYKFPGRTIRRSDFRFLKIFLAMMTLKKMNRDVPAKHPFFQYMYLNIFHLVFTRTNVNFSVRFRLFVDDWQQKKSLNVFAFELIEILKSKLRGLLLNGKAQNWPCLTSYFSFCYKFAVKIVAIVNVRIYAYLTKMR